MLEIFQRRHRRRIDLPPLQGLIDLDGIRFEKTHLRLHAFRPEHFHKTEIKRETVEIADLSDAKLHWSFHKFLFKLIAYRP